ncbi:SDR family oxidoreductase [Caballeronia sp. GAFFF2]|uniref:SDR family oxidoreductase n=1 Tax=Caballeronia sp. GAFFF2 TaxID=2921741 RepID=UPI0020276FCF|nr:SDR family oxidoreductase [Caballeronia sp. GAFFF2]
MELGLVGKRAVVLGASSGLGASCARTLLAEGADVTACGRRTALIDAWIAENDPHVQTRASSLALDLKSRESVAAAIEDIHARGGADILVLNSGGPPTTTALDARPEDWPAQFQAMACSLFELTQAMLPGMIGRQWGRIVIISSSGVEQPIARLALSNAIRASIAGWAKTLSAEVAPHGITVNLVLPGRILTDRVRQIDGETANRTGQSIGDVAAASSAAIPMARYGTADEFASVVTFLASERASYMTGGKVRVDGGMIRAV